MKTIKTLSSRIAALLLVVTVGITALPPAAVSMAAEPDADTDSMTKGKPHLTVGLPFCLFVI